MYPLPLPSSSVSAASSSFSSLVYPKDGHVHEPTYPSRTGLSCYLQPTLAASSKYDGRAVDYTEKMNMDDNYHPLSYADALSRQIINSESEPPYSSRRHSHHNYYSTTVPTTDSNPITSSSYHSNQGYPAQNTATDQSNHYHYPSSILSSTSSSTSTTSTPTSTSTSTSTLPIVPDRSLLFHPFMGDSPFLSLARQEWLSWHHRKLTFDILPFWPLSGSSKSIRSCQQDGLLTGLQGIHARFLFSQLQSQRLFPSSSTSPSPASSFMLDPLLPYVPYGIEEDIVKELTGWGISSIDSEDIVVSLAIGMSQASTACAQLRNKLLQESSNRSDNGTFDSLNGSSSWPCVLPLWGTLNIVPLRTTNTVSISTASNPSPSSVLSSSTSSASSVDDTSYLLIYEPDPIHVREYLSPVRSALSIPSNKDSLFGHLNIPLYSAIYQKDVRNTLRAENIPITSFTSVLILRKAHLEKLALLYRLTQRNVTTVSELQRYEQGSLPSFPSLLSFTTDQEFLQRVYCMLARYETFTGNASGLQGALPHHVFDALETILNVQTEGFASPLNTHFPRYCSAFPDTDIPFGSFGSFFDYEPEDNFACEVNPPFVNDTMLHMTKHLETVLDRAQLRNQSLLYFVIVPTWSDALFHELLETGKYTRIVGRLERKQHEYIDGLQYRVNARITWSANVDSTWFVLATDKAAQRLEDQEKTGKVKNTNRNMDRYITTKQRIREAFRITSSTIDPWDRVLKFYPLPKVEIGT